MASQRQVDFVQVALTPTGCALDPELLVREHDLFGQWASRWRVIRTLNAYVFSDPNPRLAGVFGGKATTLPFVAWGEGRERPRLPRDRRRN
jgi:hypothetical protein